jgi:hypothetical protein
MVIIDIKSSVLPTKNQLTIINNKNGTYSSDSTPKLVERGQKREMVGQRGKR